MSLGTRIYEQRKNIDLTQQQLAELMGVTYQTISLWERDQNKPELEKIMQLAKVLQMPVKDLLEENEEIPKDWVLHDKFFSEEHMYTFVKSAAAAHQYKQTLQALPLMREYHAGQIRKAKENIPYINHPLMMACHALAMGIADDVLLTVILMHDVCEDCCVDVEELPFSEDAKHGIAAMTHKKDKTISKEEDLQNYYTQIRQNKYASITKLIDRCNNVSQMAIGFSRMKMSEYITETENYVLPILDEVRHMYPEYFDACFLLKYQMISVLESMKRTL